MTDRALGLLGMMRKASAISPGEDRASEAVSQGRAKLLLLSSDAGEKTEVRAGRMLEGRNTRKIVLPYTRNEIGSAIGLGQCTMIAVTDLGFARRFTELLGEQDPERFSADAEAVNLRFEKAQRRKTEKPGRRNRKKSAGEE